MPISTITAKGQVTIPKAIRERLGLREGDMLEFSVDDVGQIIARPRHAGGIEGILSDFAPDLPVSIDAMKQAVRRRAANIASHGNS